MYIPSWLMNMCLLKIESSLTNPFSTRYEFKESLSLILALAVGEFFAKKDFVSLLLKAGLFAYTEVLKTPCMGSGNS